MVRSLDTRERETEILNLIVDSYIRESKPISSSHLCQQYHLPYSSATVRNVMENLEQKGFLSHIHTSSGRVPTRAGFKYYVEHLKEDEMAKDYPIVFDFETEIADINGVINHALNILAQSSGYTSFLALAGRDEKLFFRGARFMLEQPEFEDMHRLKNVFYALEMKLSQLQDLLSHYFNNGIKILVGDEIGFAEISDCSLVVSGSSDDRFSFTLALLGPMRMDYVKAASCLYTTKRQFREVMESYL
ncbi:MAG: hypothetical protein WCI77_01170 [Candidatus Omnitrophota bacterium]